MSQSKKENKQENLGGRPRKFSESSRPITVTLPERTLNLLTSIDSDRARAVVKATDWAIQAGEDKINPPVQIVEVQKGKGVIIVGPSQHLRLIPFLQLVEIAPARFLLIIPPGTSMETLEVAVTDLIEELPESEEYEHTLLGELSRCLTVQRRRNKVSKGELLLIDTSS
jgi:hypothetical protein